MKYLRLLIMLNLAACSTGNVLHDNYGNSGASRDIYDSAILDPTIRQLDHEYNKANNAINVNDAEKVYIHRFREDILKKQNGN